MTALEAHRQKHHTNSDAQVHDSAEEELTGRQRVALAEPHSEERWQNHHEHDDVAVVVGLRDVTASAQALLYTNRVQCQHETGKDCEDDGHG